MIGLLMYIRDGWHDGSGWGWIAMMVMMVAFWGGLAWLIASSMQNNRSSHAPLQPHEAAEHILSERFARGELDVDEYHTRVAALHARPKK